MGKVDLGNIRMGIIYRKWKKKLSLSGKQPELITKIHSSPFILSIDLFLNSHETKESDKDIAACCFSDLTMLWCHGNHAFLNLP